MLLLQLVNLALLLLDGGVDFFELRLQLVLLLALLGAGDLRLQRGGNLKGLFQFGLGARQLRSGGGQQAFQFRGLLLYRLIAGVIHLCQIDNRLIRQTEVCRRERVSGLAGDRHGFFSHERGSLQLLRRLGGQLHFRPVKESVCGELVRLVGGQLHGGPGQESGSFQLLRLLRRQLNDLLAVDEIIRLEVFLLFGRQFDLGALQEGSGGKLLRLFGRQLHREAVLDEVLTGQVGRLFRRQIDLRIREEVRSGKLARGFRRQLHRCVAHEVRRRQLALALGEGDVRLEPLVHERLEITGLFVQILVIIRELDDFLVLLDIAGEIVEAGLQILKGRRRVLVRAGQRGDRGNQGADTGGYAEDDPESGDRSGEQRGSGSGQFGDRRVGDDPGGQRSEHADKGRDALHNRRVFLEELGDRLQQLGSRVIRGAQRGIQCIADGDLHVVRRVLHHGHLGFGGVVHDAGFFSQRRVLIPRVVGHADRVGQKTVSRCQAEDGFGLAYVVNAELIQDDHSGRAVLFHVVQALDKGIHGADCVLSPGGPELFSGHSGDGGDLLQLVAGLGRLVQLRDQLAHGRGSGGGLDTEGTDGSGDGQDIGGAHAGDARGSGHALGHVNDLGSGRCGGVAEGGNRGTEALVIRDAGNVRKLGEHGRGVIRGQVRRCGQFGHDGGEGLHVVLRDAQLSGGCCDLCQLAGRDRHLRRHLLEAFAQALDKGIVTADGTLDGCHVRFELGGGLRAVHEPVRDLLEARDQARGFERSLCALHRLGKAFPGVFRSLGLLLLGVRRFRSFSLQTVGFRGEIGGVDSGFPQRLAHLGQLRFVLVQGGGRVGDLLFLRGDLVGKLRLLDGGRRLRFLQVFQLGLVQFQLGFALFNSLLLFLVSGDITLGTVQSFNLVLQLCDGARSGRERGAEAAAQVGVQTE